MAVSFSYLQTGECGFNGEQCTLVELTLQNPTAPGSGSSADISLIPRYVFFLSVAIKLDTTSDNVF